jgi:hypothetical protein
LALEVAPASNLLILPGNPWHSASQEIPMTDGRGQLDDRVGRDRHPAGLGFDPDHGCDHSMAQSDPVVVDGMDDCGLPCAEL